MDDIFSVPLSFLMNKNNHQLQKANYNEVDYDVYTIIWQKKVIWGATARMIVNLSDYLNGVDG